MRPDWKLLLPVFLAGFLAGAGVCAWTQRKAVDRLWRKGPDVERSLKRLTRKLDLDAAQQAQVKSALEARRDKLAALRQDSLAKFVNIRVAMKAEVAKALRPDQREKYQAMTARWEARHKELSQNRKEVP